MKAAGSLGYKLNILQFIKKQQLASVAWCISPRLFAAFALVMEASLLSLRAQIT